MSLAEQLKRQRVEARTARGGSREELPLPPLPRTDLTGAVVVLTVHNQPRVVRPCLRSVLARTPAHVRVVVVDDASDQYTAELLRDEAQRAGDRVTLLRQDQNQRYTRSVNAGFRAAFAMPGGEWAVALNSDTVVPPGWLERLLSGLGPRVGVVCPYLTSGANLTLEIPPGASYLEADRRLCAAAHGVAERRPAAVTPIGACMAVRAACWRDCGPFDEVVSPEGYGEECHFWALAQQRGWEAVTAADVLVFHEHHASFGSAEAQERERVAVARFLSAHGPRYQAAKDRAAPRDPLPALRHAVRRARVAGDTAPRVSFYITSIQLCGGVLALTNIVDRLCERGVRASLAFRNDTFGEWRLFSTRTAPIVCPAPERWLESGGHAEGVVVATAWHTGEAAQALCRAHPGLRPAAFVQDREDLFRRPDGRLEYDAPAKYEAYMQVLGTGRGVVNSRWVHASMLRDHPQLAPVQERLRYVPIGVDPDLFYPRPWLRSQDRVRVLAFSRWSTPRRGYHAMAEVYRRLRDRYGERVELLTYDQMPSKDVPATHLGKLPQPKLAEAMAACDVLIEPSTVQGWGMPAQEFMATAGCVVSGPNGGIANYGEHERNCLIADGSDPDSLFAAACRAVEDRALRERLGSAGRDTAHAFSWEKVADAWEKIVREWAL